MLCTVQRHKSESYKCTYRQKIHDGSPTKKVGHEEGWTFELILTAGYQRVLSTCDNDAVLSLPAAFIATASMSTALGLA